MIAVFSTATKLTLINQLRLEAHPHLSFTVIVNPNSGPGSSEYPDDQYSTELQKLNAYLNVETVGYVRTGYATRNITTVVSEVSTYAGWASKSSALAMHGIFFDEAPHEYSADAVEYMRSINQAVKNATGLQGDKTVSKIYF
jgi:Spherulation-specific family 4